MSSRDRLSPAPGVAVVLVLSLVVGCGAPDSGDSPVGASGEIDTPSEAAPLGSLAGSNWRLVQFQSMDDAVGTIRPTDPARFTMRLGDDGSVAMQLDCNRASGTWSAEPSVDGTSGGFTLGPLRMTRAKCPPPNLDERIGRDAEFIRSYLLRDGQLHLSLMADGGIYTWEPIADTATSFDATPDPDLEAAIRPASPDYLRKIVGDSGPEARYVNGRVDLNGDGRTYVEASRRSADVVPEARRYWRETPVFRTVRL